VPRMRHSTNTRIRASAVWGKGNGRLGRFAGALLVALVAAAPAALAFLHVATASWSD
jgi:hypothetical protein